MGPPLNPGQNSPSALADLTRDSRDSIDSGRSLIGFRTRAVHLHRIAVRAAEEVGMKLNPEADDAMEILKKTK
jgi:hypothetical protein